MLTKPYPFWKRGLDSAVDTTTVDNGQILLTTDSGRFFVDIDDNRVEVTDFVKDTEANILATLSPLPKFYFATDTHKLYYYNSGWYALDANAATYDSDGNQISTYYAPLASPALTGTPTAPTAASGTSTTQIATTAFVTAAVSSGVAGVDLSDYVTLTGSEALTNKTYNGYTLAAACAKAVSDSSAASALSSTDTNVPTVRDIYYGLPTINGSHAYTSTTSIYAPTSVGTSGYVLSSTGTGAPGWVAQSTLSVGSATKATQDGDGNVITTTYAPLASPALTGTPTAPTAASGTNTTQIATTAFVQTAVSAAVLEGIDGIDMSGYATLTGEEALTNKTYNGYTLAAACAKGVSDSSTASALSSTDTNVPTVRDVYYGLPTINGSHAYTSSTTIYAPTSVGTSGYVLTSSGSGAPSWTAQSSLSVGSATKATQDGSGNVITSTYAPLASPALTGTPTAPTATAGTSTTQIATTAFVTTAVANAVGDITSFEYSVVTSLPTTGSAGIIYLVADSHEDSNDNYDEYIWISDNAAYEKIGNTDMDLSNYVTLTGSQALTNKTYNGYTLAAACAKGVTDSTSASAISTGSSLTTERDVYYGLPTINGSHTYTSSTAIYAPTSAGTSGYILQSSGSGAPSWVATSTLTVSSASSADTATSADSATSATSATNATNVYSTLGTGTAGTYYFDYHSTASSANKALKHSANVYLYTVAGTTSADGYDRISLGNATASGTAANSYGALLMYGTGAYYGVISGAQALTANRTYYLPNAGGTFVTHPTWGTAVGTAYRPVYISSTGVATQCTVSDSTSASAIATNANLTTERDIYYGLPSINGSHTYTSSTAIYAPTSVGTSGYILQSSGSGAPSWVDTSTLTVSNASTADSATTATSATSATSATNSTNVYSTVSTGTAGTYYFDFHTTASSANKALKHSANVFLTTVAGTTTVDGYDKITLGNSTASATAANSYGAVTMYGTGAYSGTISGAQALTAARTYYLPNASGTLVTHPTWGTAVGTAYRPVYISSTGVATQCTVSDSTSASAIATNANLTTERDIYYGLPSINGSHTYTSSTAIYAPTAVGTSGYILQSSGSGAPSWVATSTITAGSASSATTASTLGTSTVGGATTPIYLSSGAATACTVTDNTAATALTTTAALVTERAVYYGLPTINNSHAYTSSTTIYAPTAGGTSGYVLVGAGTTTAPTWNAPATLIPKLGFGYGTCSTAASTTAKVVTLSNYVLVTGGLIAVKFTYAVGVASATLNVNSKGAKSIYVQGAAIEGNEIPAGATALFVYNGTQYALLAVDASLNVDYGDEDTVIQSDYSN